MIIFDYQDIIFYPHILYYRLSPANEGVVIAEPARATFIADIHKAISTARTWGEFRELMPFEEYRQLVIDFFGESGSFQAVPADDEEFDSSQIWGYDDGDYPPWLQAEIGKVLPPDLLDEYAQPIGTRLNGDYYHIEECDLVALKGDLEARGYNLVDRSDLYFY